MLMCIDVGMGKLIFQTRISSTFEITQLPYLVVLLHHHSFYGFSTVPLCHHVICNGLWIYAARYLEIDTAAAALILLV